jgi:hypothetical protein
MIERRYNICYILCYKQGGDKMDNIFCCLAKGEACATCEERPYCRDVEVVKAKEEFEKALFDRIIGAEDKKKSEK